MRKDITLTADAREMRGKNAARRLRADGKIPAVLYGAGKDSVAVTVSPKEVNKILHSSSGHNTIFNLSVAGGETTPVMVIDWLHHPVRDTLMHVDLKRIELDKPIRVKVPVHVTGEPVGVKLQGGQLDLVVREIEFEMLPGEIPEHFTVDVSALKIGQGVRASDLPVTGTMKLLSPPDTVIAHVVAVRDSVVSAGEGEAAAAPAEPEVVKKGKKEEEGAAKGKDEKKK
jgi:large subunit ribosomal protein L25